MKFTFEADDFKVFDNNAEFIKALPDTIQIVRDKRKNEFLNVPCAFDIETTNTEINGQKFAFMWIWQFGFDNLIVYGRTWETWIELLNTICAKYELSENRRLYCFVHNLQFEFQFIRHRLEWLKIFANAPRSPIYAISTIGIEFRCSYTLTGKSLQLVGETLNKYKCSKMVGDLDYSIIRNCLTPIDTKERGYVVNDIKVILCLIAEEIERNKGKINMIPLTKTSYVRRLCRKNCLQGNVDKWKAYRDLMNELQLTPEEYEMSRRAFQGGFTHGSYRFSGKTLQHVDSFDFTSSYPYVMTVFPFPMSRGRKIEIKTVEDFDRITKHYCVIFDVEFENIETQEGINEHYLSSSKCDLFGQQLTDNGRVVFAERLRTTITDPDFLIIRKCYKWDKIRIGKFYAYRRGYLPKDLILTVLDEYGKKTELKGIEGREAEYAIAKENVNSIFGDMVMNIIRGTYVYDNLTGWGIEQPDENQLEIVNKKKNRYNFYPWGVFITAWARYNLWTGGILPTGDDYIYSDTDSIKILNVNNHLADIERYNNIVRQRIKEASEVLQIPVERWSPRNKKGEEKTLGLWDWETKSRNYDRFKTLGAKRYIQEINGKLKITVAGLGKQTGAKYLQTFPDPFEAFSDDLYIPPEHTGKLLHSYIDKELTFDITDAYGQTATQHEYSCSHLSPIDFTLSLSDLYIKYLKGIRFEE